MSDCEPDTCKFDGERCTYCGWVCAKNTRQTYCMKHYRRTFPDMGCDICKLEEENARLRDEVKDLRAACEQKQEILNYYSERDKE